MKYLYILLLICIFFSCRKEETDPSDNSAPALRTTLSGTVLDEGGNAIAGVNVFVNGYSAVTNASGVFSLQDITVSPYRCIIILTKAGYIKQFYATHPFADEVTFVKAVMMKAENTFTINASDGGTVNLADGSIAIFPPNAFAGTAGTIYNGPVTINMNYINADDSSFFEKLPGRDLLARDASGNDKILSSFGMMNIAPYSTSGQPLQLAQGVKATLIFPIAANQQASAPASIPTWYFDEPTSLWKEEGSADKTGNIYTAQVSHFTWWNCDIPYPLAFISGKVFSCSGGTMSNVAVIANGNPGYVTSLSGTYAGYAPAAYPSSFELYAQKMPGMLTQIETVPILSAGQNYNVNDLIFGYSQNTMIALTGTLTDCEGDNMYGLVSVYDDQGNFIVMENVPNGSFSISVPNNTSYVINANSGVHSASANYIYQQNYYCPEFDLGNIQLCSGNSGGQFQTTLVCSELGLQTMSVDMDFCSVTTDSVLQLTEIYIMNTDSSNGNVSSLTLKVSDYANGNYTWNSTNNGMSFSGFINGIPVTVIHDLSASGGNSIFNAALPGDALHAGFSGPVIITSPLLTSPASGFMSGDFTVYRNN